MDPQLQKQLDLMVRNAQQQANQDLLVLLIIGAISTLLTLWALYWVIRWGVRDGMKDANQQLRRAYQNRTPELKDGLKTKLPDMRAD